MPGGNTSSSKRPYRMLKGGGQKPYDVRALSGSETFGDERNMKLDSYQGDPEYGIDTEYGYPSFSTPTKDNTPKEVDGNDVWMSANPPAPPKSGPTKPKQGDATPGGGWE